MAMPALVPTYTIDDLEAFPQDGNRYELLDGILLVTPQAAVPHQVVAARITAELHSYLKPQGLAHIAGPGAVEIRPKTHLEPDVLVFPSRFPIRSKWWEIRDWLLAVEVFSPSSVIYDRDFKRNAYLALGVAEVWLVDLDEKEILVSRRGGPTDLAVRERVVWAPADMPAPLELDLNLVFAGL
jgi:Uma2 family endonuclease